MLLCEMLCQVANERRHVTLRDVILRCKCYVQRHYVMDVVKTFLRCEVLFVTCSAGVQLEVGGWEIATPALFVVNLICTLLLTGF